MDPNSISMLKTDLFSEIKKAAKKFKKVETQRERTELILDLKELADSALVIGTLLGAFFGVKA